MVSDFCFIFKEAFVDSGNALMFMKTASIVWTVSSELLGFCFYFFFFFFVSVPCARLSWPSRQVLCAR